MKPVPLVCATSLLLFPSIASANDDITDISHGDGLFSALSRCAANSTMSFGKENSSDDDFHDCLHATSYILGVIDAFPISIPKGVTYAHEWDIVYGYLKNHMNQRQRFSVGLIREALVEAFPPPKANAPAQ
jgi:hypothetical protein